MQIGMVGLGRMGANMTTRLLRGGHQVVVYDRSDEAVRHAATEGAAPTSSLEELIQKLNAPRAVWIMVPAGEPTEQTVQSLARLRSVFETLAPGKAEGWGHVGPSGSGHFVKMVHNGIEYGLMQAYAEGFSILKHKEEFGLDLAQVAEIWRSGSVVRSWLLELTAAALAENPSMEGIAPHVSDSGEGRWTVAEAIDLDVPAPVITHS